MKTILNVKNLTKNFGGLCAVSNVSMTINEGELIGLIGPNGAGKTTLFNLLTGVYEPSSGLIELMDQDKSIQIGGLKPYKITNLGVARTFQNIRLFKQLTVLENVEIVKDIVKKPKSAKKILKDVGLGDHLNKFPNQLSGGEQQRVSIARAIAKNPKLLLCDEPTGALDSKTGVEVLKLLKKQCDANNGENTVIIVTHNALIAEVADRVIRLKNGQIESNTVNKHPKNIDEVEW